MLLGATHEQAPLEPGNLVDLQAMIAAVTKPLKLYSDGHDVTIDDAKRLSKNGALKHLIVEHGLREKTAKLILTNADKAGQLRDAYTVLLKYAAPGSSMGDMVSGAPGAPPFPEPNIGWDAMTGSNLPTQEFSQHNLMVPDMSASTTDRSVYYFQGPDPKSIAVAQQAAQTGQREVFDTAMLGSMLKAVRQESMVDRYMGDLVKGMDRLGRILFIFYWHGEDFEDRYGKQDMPEMEDALRNSFESLGDLVLSLKRKTVEPYPDDGSDPDLKSVANQ